MDDLEGLERWAADARAREAADARVRERWLRAQAEEEAARIRQRGEEQISAAREQAVRQLRGEIGGLSVQLAERLIADSLADEARRSATVDAFLAELDAMAERPQTAPAGGAS